MDRPFGTRTSMGYTSDGCVADRLAVGRGLEAWTSACRLAFLVAMSDASSTGMDERMADSAAFATPAGAVESWAFSAIDWAALRDCLVPKVLVSSVRCARIVF